VSPREHAPLRSVPAQDPDADQPRRGDDTEYQGTAEMESDLRITEVVQVPEDKTLLETPEVRLPGWLGRRCCGGALLGVAGAACPP
jgi:hypothetical protein